MAAKKLSARTARRADERKIAKEAERRIEERARLAALEDGGSAQRPLAVESASLVEPIAKGARCVRCDGGLDLLEHAVEIREGISLRVARLRCRACGAPRTLWFRIAPRLLH